MAPFVHHWYMGARPRTLPASIIPVLIGTAAASTHADIVWWKAFTAMAVALLLQVGVNYANDYSDGIRGTDANRVGPLRLVASGLAPAESVKRAAFVMFGLAAVVGAVLSLTTEPWLLLIGAAAIPAAWFYTGGRRPYGYAGLGELFVFVFFGLVATLGSEYVQAESLSSAGVVGAVSAGLLAVALLLVNNLRDIEGDKQSGKRTLVVRIGDRPARVLYTACAVLPFAGVAYLAFVTDERAVLMAFAALIAAFGPLGSMWSGSRGRALLPALAATGRFQLVFGVLFSVGLVL